MSIELKEFRIHDVTAFPLVVLQTEEATNGYALQWQKEMNALLIGAPFVLFLKSRQADEAHEDRKQRSIWLKKNKLSLQKVCKGMISLIAATENNEEAKMRGEAFQKAFGISIGFVTCEQEVMTLAEQLLSK